jgi:hypothetical protein
MIRIVSLKGRVPVEAFLRAARELAFAASEVARAVNTAATDALPLLGAGVVDLSLDGTASNGMGMPQGWCIVDAQCSGPADISGSSGATSMSGVASAVLGRHSVTLTIAPPAAQRQACQHMCEGMRMIQARCEERPAGFTDATLRSVRRLALMSARQLRISVSAGQGEGKPWSWMPTPSPRSMPGWGPARGLGQCRRQPGCDLNPQSAAFYSL